ncbi:hypothetical protein DFJ74DRAFT_711787 [Hyaloraphidium curvatum]|nr:hypothetical protein DFJ74DRAFT_711787 [Hyaloraphidium curvatum]
MVRNATLAALAVASALAALVSGIDATPIIFERQAADPACVAPQGAAPVQMAKLWTCMQHGTGAASYIAVSTTPGGNPACLSRDARNCIWTSDECCKGLVNTAGSTAPFLECGPPHAAIWGDSGMVDPEGWCMKAMDMLGDEDLGEASRGRVFISDNETATVHVVSLDGSSSSERASFVRSIPVGYKGASVQANADGRFAFLAHYANGSIEVIDSGLYLEAHDDHFHLEDAGASLHPFAMRGTRPTHINVHDGLVVYFFDGDASTNATVAYYNASDLEAKNATITPRTFVAAVGHHGTAVPHQGYFVVSTSRKNGTTGSPVASGVTVRPISDPTRVIYEADNCTSLHGEATAGTHIVFGCIEGLLDVDIVNGTVTHKLVPYPANSTGRVGTLKSHHDLDLTVAVQGNSVLSYNTTSGTLLSKGLPGGTRPYRFDISADKSFVVLDANGTLHQLDPVTLDPIAGKQAIRTIGDEAKGMLAVGGDRAVVTKAGESTVQVVDLEGNRIRGNVTIPGKPYAMAVAGVVSAEPHDH